MAIAGPNFVTVAANDDSVGFNEWTNTQRLVSTNLSYAGMANGGLSFQTNRLKATGFKFNLPLCNITGIRVNIVKAGNVVPNALLKVTDYEVKLLIGGVVVGDNKADTFIPWPRHPSQLHSVYGGPGDLWGLNPSYLDINGDTFGVAYSAYITDEQHKGIGALLDSISITVYGDFPSDIPGV